MSICALSGQEITEPVVSPAGYVFERSLIEKYLAQNDKCPISDEPLSLEELIPLRINKAVPPRPVGASSVPGLLRLFQSEWDAAALETFTLKKQLDSVRQELAHALYQNDASCRVIARLMKERDDARQALVELREQTQKGGPQESMDVETEGIPSALVDEMKVLSQQLAAKRSSRDKSAIPQEQLKQFSEKQSVALHKASDPGLLAVDVHVLDSDMIVTGGMDNTAVLFNSSQTKKLAVLSGHSKPVSQVAFHPEDTAIVTGSRDSTVRLWTASQGSTDYKTQSSFQGHKQEITSVQFHPLHNYVVSTSKDQTWAFHSLDRGTTLTTVSSPEVQSPILCGNIHPDSLLLATGQENGTVALWDIGAEKKALSFGQLEATRSLQFSENGFQIVTAGPSEIALWDLRKLGDQQPVKRIQLDPSFNLSSISLTHSSVYLAAAGSSVRLYDTQSLEEITNLTGHLDRVTGVQWNRAGTSLATVSLDRNLKVFAQ